MSDTEQQRTENTLSLENDGFWGAKLAALDQDSESITEMKKFVEHRGWSTRVVDGAKTFGDLLEHDPGRAGSLLGQGATDALVSSVTMVADVVSFVSTDVWAMGANKLSNAVIGTDIVLEDKGGFFSITEKAQALVQFTDPIQQRIIDEDGVQIRNPYADAEWFSKGVGTVIIDAGAFVGTAGLSGTIIGGTKGALGITTRSLKVVRASDRINDAVKLFEKAQKLTNKANKIAETGVPAAKLFNKAAKYEKRAENILAGKTARTWLESLPGNISSKVKQVPVEDLRGAINAKNMEQYITHKLVDPIGIRGLFAKLPMWETPAQKIIRAEKIIKETSDGTSRVVQKAVNKWDKSYKKLQTKLDDGVNEAADRIGHEGFSVDDALKLADNIPREQLNYGRNILERSKIGAYKGFRFADPLENPAMEVIGGGGMMSVDYYLYKKGAEQQEAKGKDLYKRASGATEDDSVIDKTHERILRGNFKTSATGGNSSKSITSGSPDGDNHQEIKYEFSNEATGDKIHAGLDIRTTQKNITQPDIDSFMKHSLLS